MTIKATKFAFDEEFTSDRRTTSFGRRSADLERLKQAEEEGFARGLIEGRRDTEDEAAMRMAVAIEALAAQSAEILARLDGERAHFETEAAELAMAFARKLAGEAVAREPLAALEAAAAECFRQLSAAPHLVARVPSDLVDRVKAVLDRQAHERGFEGRLVILGEPDMAVGDFQLEWADGGLARDARALDRQVSEAIARHIGPPAGGLTGRD
jgi:flagellar assembly protein FliH